jgi:hypothetical protein
LDVLPNGEKKSWFARQKKIPDDTSGPELLG